MNSCVDKEFFVDHMYLRTTSICNYNLRIHYSGWGREGREIENRESYIYGRQGNNIIMRNMGGHWEHCLYAYVL